MTPIIDALRDIEMANTHVKFSDTDFSLPKLISGVAPLDGAGTEYVHYQGSLTTPHCNEVVEWILFTTPLNISTSQMHMFRHLKDSLGHDLKDNFRPPQPLNGREVLFYGPRSRRKHFAFGTNANRMWRKKKFHGTTQDFLNLG